jgi:DNA gyrase subunit B
MTKKPMIKPIMIFQDTGIMKADIAMVYIGDAKASPNVITFANMTPVNTVESTPSKGFMRGVQDFFRNYMNKIYLANTRSKLEATNGDVTTGLVAAVSSCHMEVMFDGQAKNVCKNEDLEPFVHDVTVEALQQWSKSNPDDLQKVCAFLKEVALARSRADKEIDKVNKKYNNGDFTKLPKGYIKAENKDNLELFIVEGLSASAPCETARDCSFQAIYAIRGKMPNAFSTPKAKFLENEEVKGILSILGAGCGKNFDITKCPFDKVIILADM